MDKLTDAQITVLAHGCTDSTEGPYFVMPDETYLWLKAAQIVDLAQRVKAAQGLDAAISVAGHANAEAMRILVDAVNAFHLTPAERAQWLGAMTEAHTYLTAVMAAGVKGADRG